MSNVGNRVSSTAAKAQGASNLVFYLLIAYLFLDLVRPSFVWQFPKIISAILLIAWVTKADKAFCPQMWGFVAFLGVLGFDILIAVNTYDAFWTTYGMFILLICVCFSLIVFTDTIARIRRLVNTLLLILLYIAVYAISHAGFGPAGSDGGQDENYVAAAMNLAIPLAAFSFFAERSKWKKIWFAGLVCAYILAIVVGLSRGGFLGLVAAFAFSIMKSPKRTAAIVASIVFGGFLFLVAGASYWEEMSTIKNTNEGTADLRLEFWKIAVDEFLAYPLTGVGGGNFPWQMPEFQSAEQTDRFGRKVKAEVHSTFFQLLAELGLAGCAIFGFLMYRTYQDYRRVDLMTSNELARASLRSSMASYEDLKWMQAYGRGVMGGLIGYLVSVAFLSALYYSHLWLGISLMATLHMVTSRVFNGKQLVTGGVRQ